MPIIECGPLEHFVNGVCTFNADLILGVLIIVITFVTVVFYVSHGSHKAYE